MSAGFNDKRLDASLDAILGLAHDRPRHASPADEADLPTLHRIKTSRRASTSVAVSLGIAATAGVGFVIGHHGSGDAPPPPHRVIDVPATPAAAPATPATVAITTPIRRLRRPRASATDPAIPIVPATPLLAEALAAAVRGDDPPAPIVTAAVAPSPTAAPPPAATPAPPTPTPSADPTEPPALSSEARARRDSIDAMRALRRQ